MSPKMNRRPSRISHSVGSLPSLILNGVPVDQKPPYCGSYFAGSAMNMRRCSSLTKK